MDIFLYLAIAVASALASVVLLTRRKRHGPYPPGPRPLPILGNILDVPRERAWNTFRNWSRLYSASRWYSSDSRDSLQPSDSDVVHIKLLGTHMVVLHSAEAAKELFEKHGAVFSDRYVEGTFESEFESLQDVLWPDLTR